MYYPHAPEEPSGCAQTIVVTRAIIGILFVPLMIILGAILFILFTFYALSVSPWLGLLVILGGGSILLVAARWEWKRVSKELPPEEE